MSETSPKPPFFIIFCCVLIIILATSGAFGEFQENSQEHLAFDRDTEGKTSDPGKRYKFPDVFQAPGHEVLDHLGRYTLEWEVDRQKKLIHFDIQIKNTGWVGLGLSLDGTMKKADIMIAGVDPNGRAYLRDYVTDLSRNLQLDPKQDWKLNFAREENGVLKLKIERALKTCDGNDIEIGEDLLWAIWAYGENDEMEYHFEKRGSFRVYLTDPIWKTTEPLQMFRVSKKSVVKPKLTTYWCSIHKPPRLPRKHHVVKADYFFADKLSQVNVHHMVIKRCFAPPGMSTKEIFEPFVNHPGEECIFQSDRKIPIRLCSNSVQVHAYGMKPYVFPEDFGLPVGESEDEYWLLNYHVNNPDEVEMTIEAGFDLYYTSRLRPHDSQSLYVGYDFFGIALLPPISTSFQVHGICSEKCTEKFGPFHIVTVQHHTHYSGRKVKLQHFRDGKELPWILKDDNWNAGFQQYRNLVEPRLVLPGDKIVMQCEFDNSRVTNGSVITAFATKDEMCLSLMKINKIIPYQTCFSQARQQSTLDLIGVEDYEWEYWSGERIATYPPSVAGRLLTDIANDMDWTKSLRKKIQDIQTQDMQDGTCSMIYINTPSQRGNESTLFQAPGVDEELESLKGTIIEHHEDPANIIDLAKGYGETTLMGSFKGIPKRTPGHIKETYYPHEAQSFVPESHCKHPYPLSPLGPFTERGGTKH